jgi:uncharacterized membrane protein HdeD (DUF308 family)
MKKYKYKLNMLEPGWKMVKAIGIFGIAAFVFYIINVDLLCYIFGILAALIGIVLWVLLMIESHQDKVLNDQAIQERREN